MSTISFSGQRQSEGLAARFSLINMMDRTEKDTLVNDVADLLDSHERSSVIGVLNGEILRALMSTSSREYDNFQDFERARCAARRLAENLGIVTFTMDGMIVDNNNLHRPLNADGAYYSKVNTD